jgi:hypothetical protein
MGLVKYAPAALPPGKTLIPTVQKAGWDPSLGWTGMENLASTGV